MAFQEEITPDMVDVQSLGDAYARTRLVSAKDQPYVMSSVFESTAVIAEGRRQRLERYGLYCSQSSAISRVAIQVFHAGDEILSLLVTAGMVLMLSIGLCPCTSSSENQFPCRP